MDGEVHEFILWLYAYKRMVVCVRLSDDPLIWYQIYGGKEPVYRFESYNDAYLHFIMM